MLRLSFRRMGLRPSGALRPVWARELAKKAGKSVRSEPARSSKSEPGEEGGEGPDLEKVASQMERSLSKLLKDFYAVQVGRATPAMLEAIQVSPPSGGPVPLSAVGKALAQSARLLQVSVFDAANVPAVAKAIETSGLQLVPEVNGKTVKVTLPRPTTETREALRREVKRAAEEARTALRAVRHKAMKKAKNLSSKDEVKRVEKEVDKLADSFTDRIDKETAKKEADVMEI